MQKIKYCPFCGWKTPLLMGDHLVWVQCPKCGARNHASICKTEVIEAWNNRFDELEAVKK